MPKVTFLPDSKQVEVPKGENILRAAMAAEVKINASCGGDGTCGKCKVFVDKGEVKQKPGGKLDKKEQDKGVKLACLTTVESDVEVRIPVESRLGKPARKREYVPTCGHILSAREWEKRLKWEVEPAFKKFYLEIPKPTLDDSIGDLRRIRRELRKNHNLDGLDVDFSFTKDLAKVLRDGDFKVTVTVLDTGLESKLISVEPGDTCASHYAVALDIGTTTVVAQLVDLNQGETVAESSDYNAQASCGADIISRIVYSTKKDGLEKLTYLVRDKINSLIADLIKKSEVSSDSICGIIVAGNTTMLHLLLGLDPRHIREEPYIPTVTENLWLKAKDIEIKVSEKAYLHTFPCVASYIGGDIVAGVLASGMFQTDKLTLYIDIGTNGEIVLGNKEWLMAVSCSAGPAFEGGVIKHGTRAVAGAIEQVRIDEDTLEPMILTVEQKKPIGICGTGLVDLLAELFLSGAIDQKGKINLEVDTKRIREGELGPEYVLVWKGDSDTGEDIVITEVDIDNLMRAKAAIFAGIKILVESSEVEFKDIDEVLIAGAFGNYLEVEKVMTIGLLPELPCDKFTFIGNGSLLGAHLVAMSKEMDKEAAELAQKITYVDLSTNPKFMDEYVSALFLPHTNIEMFPTVKKSLKGRG